MIGNLKFNKRQFLDIIDRILFTTISNIYNSCEINQIPIYISKTALEDESTGKIPYKLFTVRLTSEFQILILGDINFSYKVLKETYNKI